MCEEQELDTQTDADRPDITKEHRIHLGPEELEAALRVRHVGQSEAPDEEVEHLTGELPVQTNLASDGRIPERPRAHGDVGARQAGGLEALELPDGRGAGRMG